MYTFTPKQAYDMWCFNQRFIDNIPQATTPPMTEQEEKTYLEYLMREEEPSGYYNEHF